MINYDEREMKLLGRAFFQAVERGNPDTVASYLEEGMPVNYQDPDTKQAALHVAAACKAREAVRVLARQPDCNFILRDRRGRLPSEMAYAFGNDPALARYLGNKERTQAEAQGLKLTYRRTLPVLTVITPK
ncbi:ankyrin repeat domain-containing protein [Halomonas sp. TRM85114]|uniref:ankyrin repeat domain-containing protein n=1 Tax=Halomonas jincaotanensis TaxID=2810616 RepID=UPI001BD5AC4D|nr:ankyrin repeat domain-containing protein [Halomonas jincaotanensis]MBS9405470.1 ankyrin repeat domain-containing protein [Halomonas jincaotanensis]